jgi:hypothetical protein
VPFWNSPSRTEATGAAVSQIDIQVTQIDNTTGFKISSVTQFVIPATHFILAPCVVGIYIESMAGWGRRIICTV